MERCLWVVAEVPLKARVISRGRARAHSPLVSPLSSPSSPPGAAAPVRHRLQTLLPSGARFCSVDSSLCTSLCVRRHLGSSLTSPAPPESNCLSSGQTSIRSGSAERLERPHHLRQDHRLRGKAKRIRKLSASVHANHGD